MRILAHADAPANDLADRIWSMVMDRAPSADVVRILLHDFDAARQVISVPGYVQPNGFLTFKLGGHNGDNVLRLHFWPAGMPEKSDSAGPHDHNFDFTSLVFAGDATMINTVYNLSSPGEADGLNLYRAEYTSHKGANIKHIASGIKPLPVLEEIVSPGQYYSLKAGLFHNSQIQGDKEAITLLASRLNPAHPEPRFLAQYFSEKTSRVQLTHDHRTLVAQRLAGLKSTLSL
jgi:hypothetical protein